jgi:hypothetical protein
MRAFLHEVRTFVADVKSEEKIGKIRQLLGGSRTTPGKLDKDKRD